MPTTAYDETKITPISPVLDENVKYINELIGVGKSWDLIAKPFSFGNLKMMSYVANGFFLTMNEVLILENFEKNIREFVDARAGTGFSLIELSDYLSHHISFVQVQPVKKMNDAVRFILSGPLITFFDGFDEALLIDTRIYPMRSIQESEVERVIRGARDGFVETMLMNTAMIRRRLRDPRLRVELMQIGERSQTDVSLMYLQDVTNDDLVEDIKSRLKSLKVDGVFMGEQTITDLIGKVKWNPFPIVRYTERPDVAATALVEGQVVIIVDTSPEAIIAPTSLFQHLQQPQEYHSYPFVGTYMRWVILCSVLVSMVLPGVFLLMNSHPELMPKPLSFFKAERSDPLPLWVEIVIAEVTLDVLRLAVINTPTALANAVGVVAALLFGQFATKIQLLQPEVLVYMGLVMIGQFAISSYELGSATQMARYWLTVWTGLLTGWGFLIGIATILVLLLRTRSFGVPYLWPLIPFQWKNGMREVLFRMPTSDISGRPTAMRTKLNRRRGV